MPLNTALKIQTTQFSLESYKRNVNVFNRAEGNPDKYP
jgi:hypothetical protein